MSKQNELAQLADAVTVDGSNVGIGTSSPAALIDLKHNSASTHFRLTENTSGNWSALGVDTSDNLRIYTNNDERMRIDSSGQLLHGISSTPTGVSLGRQLISSSSTGSEIIAFREDSSVAVGDKCGALLIGNSDPDGAEDHFVGMWGKASSTNGSQNLHFAAGRSGYEGDVPQMTLDSSGNVGIGTTSPTNYTNYSTVALNGTNGGVLEFKKGNTQVSRISNANDQALQFVTNSAERMRIDNSGRVTKPYQPSFAASKNNGHLTSGTMIYNDVRHNVGSHYNSSNGRFTAPVTGRYFIGSMLMSMNDANYNNASYIIAKNGTSFQRAYNSSGGSFHHQYQWSGIVSLSVNDYVTIVYSNATMYGVDSSYSWFSGHLLG